MPTYEYECETCGIHFERWQRFSDDPLKKCPECDGTVHRVPYPVGIVFKGSGFYCTDNRTGSSTAVGKDRSDKSEHATESKTDSQTTAEKKAEPKAESKD